jgi:hypothetical protein
LRPQLQGAAPSAKAIGGASAPGGAALKIV